MTPLKHLVTICLMAITASAATNEIANPLINYDAFQSQVADVGRQRKTHRVTEEEFIQMASDPSTIVFDARSDDKYTKLHVKGAKHLSLPDITADELAKIIPSKATRILIYCNNNFLNAPGVFPSKAPSASLNIHTMNTLFSYGYTNVFELGPLIDINKAKIEFEGSQQVSK
jgi:phage shock protein E